MSPEMQTIVSFLIPAYIVFWLVTFLYVLSIRSRQRNLEKDVEALKKMAEKKQSVGVSAPAGKTTPITETSEVAQV
jgi:CcmD family protein